ncbi:hypothetical protein PHACT_10045 [Pseudohongiella acticola]|uniref:Uncharacterized protein n=1 Tax=Pseudohongiella acticola TaxID=1524254 RepID=A0A1E8CLT2_9GAMM|nr:hypothetical protein [Pseudohongiella acticola]OFE13436.1 hypothetical protein PHACT_10045 [Pseudohongiella acticola]
MLEFKEQIKGISAIKEVIFSLMGVGEAYKGAMEDLRVSAEVGGKLIIDSEIIKCQFAIHHNRAEVHIMWEDYGYKAYKALGLFGSMNTDWQYLSTLRDGVLEIKDKEGTYKITVKYAS